MSAFRPFPMVASAVAAVLVGAIEVPVARAETISFLAGTYHLAQYPGGPVVDTLKIRLAGGDAAFDLSGADNVTFVLPDGAPPAGLTAAFVGYAPYVDLANAPGSASWDVTAFPYITFWPTAAGGGFTIATQYDDGGVLLADIYGTAASPDQLYVLSGAVPEPAAWALMLLGVAALGVALRRSGGPSAIPA